MNEEEGSKLPVNTLQGTRRRQEGREARGTQRQSTPTPGGRAQNKTSRTGQGPKPGSRFPGSTLPLLSTHGFRALLSALAPAPSVRTEHHAGGRGGETQQGPQQGPRPPSLSVLGKADGALASRVLREVT